MTMNLDIKPYFAENPTVAADYAGTGRVFSLTGNPAGMSVGATTAAGAAWGVIAYPAPRQIGLYTIGVRCIDCPDANAPNGLGVYDITFMYPVYGNAHRGWAAGYQYDSNSKSVTALVNTSFTASTYEMLLVPMSGQTWANPNIWRDLVNQSGNIGAQTFNRRVNTPPAFAGGIDVTAGTWALIIRDKNLTSDIVVYQLILSNVGSEVVIAAGNQPPTIPAFTIPGAVVNQAYSFQFPAATDPEGQALTYFLNGSIPSGMSWNASTRTLSGTPVTAQTQSLIYQASDGVNTTSAPAQNLVVGNVANNAPVLPDFTFPVMVVGQPYSFSFPVATDNDGPSGLVYSVTGMSSLPLGISETFANGVRTWSGTPRQTGPSSHSITYSVTDGVNTTSRTKTLTVQGCSDYRVLTSADLGGQTSRLVYEYNTPGQTNAIGANGEWRTRNFVSVAEMISYFASAGGNPPFDIRNIQDATVGKRCTGSNNPDVNNSSYPAEAGYVAYDLVNGGTGGFKWVLTDSCGYITQVGTHTVAAGTPTVRTSESTNVGKLNLTASVVNGWMVISNAANPGFGGYKLNGTLPLVSSLAGNFTVGQTVYVEWYSGSEPSDQQESGAQCITIHYM